MYSVQKYGNIGMSVFMMLGSCWGHKWQSVASVGVKIFFDANMVFGDL